MTTTLQAGNQVYLRRARFGQPGTVVRIERNRAVVLWHDLDYLGHHSPDSLELDEPQPKGATSNE